MPKLTNTMLKEMEACSQWRELFKAAFPMGVFVDPKNKDDVIRMAALGFGRQLSWPFIETGRTEWLIDLTGQDLSGASIFMANMQYACLNEIKASGIIMMDGFFMRTRFDGADLTNANLSGTGFYACDFHEANLSGANLRSTAFAGCDMGRVDMTGCDISGAVFDDCGWATTPNLKIEGLIRDSMTRFPFDMLPPGGWDQIDDDPATGRRRSQWRNS